MRRATQALWALYTILALFLFRCALVSYHAHHIGYTAMFAAASIGAALAIVHTSWLIEEYRAVLVAVDRASLPERLKTRQDITVDQALAAACCEEWWTTAGAEHTCTRKDQTL